MRYGIHDLEMHEASPIFEHNTREAVTACAATRVPGGLLYVTSIVTRGGPSITQTFVPFTGFDCPDSLILDPRDEVAP